MKLRITILALTLLALAAFTAGAYVYYRAMRTAALTDAEVRMASEVGAIASRIADALRENLKTARILAGLPAVVETLKQPEAERLLAAERLLGHFRQALNADVCYLMNAGGLIVATSNSPRPPNFASYDHAFQPYFRNAMQGMPWVDLGVGPISGKRGIYSSHPVTAGGDENPLLGVVVIKNTVEPLEAEINHAFTGDWVLVDPDGRVFAASRNRWQQRPVWPEAGKPGTRQKKRAGNHRNADSGIGMWPTGDRRAVDAAGREYLVHEALVPGFRDWRVMIFNDRDKIPTGLDSPIFDEKRAMLILLTLVFTALIGSLYAVAREDMRQRQQTHAALYRHSAYMEALHEATLSLIGRMALNELIESVLRRAGTLAGTRNGFMLLYRAEDQLFELNVGLGMFSRAVGLRFKPGEGLVGRVFTSDQPMVVADYSRWEHRLDDRRFDPLRAVIAIPLQTGGRIIGVMGLAHLKPEKNFGREEQDALMRLAELATIVLDNAMLQARLEQELNERRQAQQALHQANAELHRLAVIDGLTQVANRRFFDERLDCEWRRMGRKRQPLSLLICDVDHFKAFNDSSGHLAGDECLRKVACAIRAHARRPGDLVARYGGEEFAVILSHTDAPGALCVAEQIRCAVEGLGILHPASPTAERVTVSLGGTSRVIDGKTAPETLVAEADCALYAAKNAGRNRVVIQ